MTRIKGIIISYEAPSAKEVGWLLPTEDGAFDLKFFGPNGWVSSASGVQGPKGDTGDTGAQGPAGADGKSITAIELTTNAEGAVTGGTATLSDNSTIQITVTTSEG